jgi:hypothetical protein
MRLSRWLGTVAVVAAVTAVPRPAQALVFEDISAYLQRALHYVVQFREMMAATNDTKNTLMGAYTAIKDGEWRNIPWQDALDVVHAPWFDEVEGIEDIRDVVDLTIANAEQANKLFKDVVNFGKLEGSERYRTDGWFRSRVNGLRTINRRAVAHRRLLFRQLQQQNDRLTNDVKKITKLRKKIEDESKKSPVNGAAISAWQGELAALEGRWSEEKEMVVNQRALMFMVGEENMHELFYEMADGDWVHQRRQGFENFGRELTRRR